MGFYEKDGKRIPESKAFEYALESVETGDALMEDAFLDWFTAGNRDGIITRTGMKWKA